MWCSCFGCRRSRPTTDTQARIARSRAVQEYCIVTRGQGRWPSLPKSFVELDSSASNLAFGHCCCVIMQNLLRSVMATSHLPLAADATMSKANNHRAAVDAIFGENTILTKRNEITSQMSSRDFLIPVFQYSTKGSPSLVPIPFLSQIVRRTLQPIDRHMHHLPILETIPRDR